MSMTLQWIAVVAIIAAAVVIPLYRRFKNRGKGKNGCVNCPLNDSCAKK